MTSLELAKEAAKILDSKKGIDIQAIGVREVTTLAAVSYTHLRAHET